jgi:hypothetical protein
MANLAVTCNPAQLEQNRDVHVQVGFGKVTGYTLYGCYLARVESPEGRGFESL